MKTLILNFHGIGPPPDSTPKSEISFWLNLEFFKWIISQTVGKKNILLTFDDGNASDYYYVFPTLMARGLIGKFFICSEQINSSGYLNHSQIQEMVNSGMQFGTHGKSHHSWRNLPKKQLSKEIHESRMHIMNITQNKLYEAACPFGDYGISSLSALRHAGIKRVYTSDAIWWNGVNWIAPRYTIKNNITYYELRRLILGYQFSLSESIKEIKQYVKQFRF